MKPLRKSARCMTLLELIIGMTLASLLLVMLTDFYFQVSTLNINSEQAQKESFKVRYVENRLSKILPAALEKVNGHFYFYTSNDLNGLLADKMSSLVFLYDAGISDDPLRSGPSLGRLYLDKQGRICLATWPDPKDWEKNSIPPKAHTEVLLEGIKELKFLFYVAPERDRSMWRNQGKSNNAASSSKDDASEKKAAKEVEAAGKSETSRIEDTKKELPSKDAAQTSSTNKDPSNKGQEPNENAKPPSEEDKKIEPEPKDQWIPEWRREYKELPAMIKVIVTPIDARDDEKDIIFAFPFPNSHQAIVYEVNQ